MSNGETDLSETCKTQKTDLQQTTSARIAVTNADPGLKRGARHRRANQARHTAKSNQRKREQATTAHDVSNLGAEERSMRNKKREAYCLVKIGVPI